MQDAVRARLFSFILGLIIVPIASFMVILFARGYRPDFQKRELMPTGLLVAHSYPDGAQVYIDGQLKTATNTTVSLAPGTYDVEITKDGYQAWKKSLQVETGVVTRATATLFPSVPSLKQITLDGAAIPTLSPDGSKVAFTSVNSKNIFLLDLNESPLGLINRDPKLITTLPETITRIIWSPDSRQILATARSASASGYLIDASGQQTRNVTANIKVLTTSWQTSVQARDAQKFSTLPKPLQEILATSSADLTWSPRENKLLYTATASASLPDDLQKPLPGSSTQPQERILRPGSVYVYDLEEDRNFKVGETTLPTPTPTPKTAAKNNLTQSSAAQSTPPGSQSATNAGLRWLPTSSHLIRVEENKIIIFEYDSENPVIVYAGPLSDTNVIPYPSAKQMLILTNLTPSPVPGQTTLSNLYALTLR